MAVEREETDDKGESLCSEKKLLVVGEIILSLTVFHSGGGWGVLHATVAVRGKLQVLILPSSLV